MINIEDLIDGAVKPVYSDCLPSEVLQESRYQKNIPDYG